MSRRAVWKGTLAFGQFGFGVGLYSALSSADRVSFHIVNRKTGNRVERQYLDSETGRRVDASNRCAVTSSVMATTSWSRTMP